MKNNVVLIVIVTLVLIIVGSAFWNSFIPASDQNQVLPSDNQATSTSTQ